MVKKVFSVLLDPPIIFILIFICGVVLASILQESMDEEVDRSEVASLVQVKEEVDAYRDLSRSILSQLQLLHSERERYVIQALNDMVTVSLLDMCVVGDVLILKAQMDVQYLQLDHGVRREIGRLEGSFEIRNLAGTNTVVVPISYGRGDISKDPHVVSLRVRMQPGFDLLRRTPLDLLRVEWRLEHSFAMNGQFLVPVTP